MKKTNYINKSNKELTKDNKKHTATATKKKVIIGKFKVLPEED